MNKPLRIRLLPLVIGSLLAASSAFAQNTSSSLSGRLVDASGRPVAGATVQILHVPSGTTKTVTTDANGNYVAHGLRVGGPFFVTADKAGETAERNDVYLKLAEETKLDLTTGVTDAMTLEGITVTASALTQNDVSYLDFIGNKNGSFDVGDFRAWVDSTNAEPVTITPAPADGGGR